MNTQMDWANHFKRVSQPLNVEFGAHRGRRGRSRFGAGDSSDNDPGTPGMVSDPNTGDSASGISSVTVTPPTNYSAPPDPSTLNAASSGGDSGTSSNVKTSTSTVSDLQSSVDNVIPSTNVNVAPPGTTPVIVPLPTPPQPKPAPVPPPTFFQKLTASLKAHPYLWAAVAIMGIGGVTLMAAPHKVAGLLAA